VAHAAAECHHTTINNKGEGHIFNDMSFLHPVHSPLACCTKPIAAALPSFRTHSRLQVLKSLIGLLSRRSSGSSCLRLLFTDLLLLLLLLLLKILKSTASICYVLLG